MVERLGIPLPESRMAITLEEARAVAAVDDVTPERLILIYKFLDNALGCEADALSDGTDAFVPAAMEHVEYAGVHSGDWACVIPPVSIPPKHLQTIRECTRRQDQRV
jgi:carbamoyl-phosphate synthase large subunit